jgi:hypothetical protein
MSANFYVRPEGACCDQCSRWVHLGKSSAGWAFTFRAYPDGGSKTSTAPSVVTWPVLDYESWLKLLDLGTIYNEYGGEYTREDLLDRIKGTRRGRNDLARSDYLDKDGHRFVPEEFS